MAQIIPQIENRHARRAIDARRIPEEVIDRILAAATFAPSCSNNQPWRLVAITDSAVLRDVKTHLSDGNYWAKTAPAIVAVCTNPDDDCRLSARRDYALFDVGMATMNLMSQGIEEGLHLHPIAGFDPLPVREIIGVPDETILVTLIIIGFPGSDEDLNEKHKLSEHSARKRKPIDEVVAYDRWPSRWSTQP